MVRIYLVGFMGAGKSTIGRELSLKLRTPFLDLDTEIEKAERLPVREIFERFGEAHFRQTEREHLQRVSQGPAAVVALGGGTYIDPENRKLIDASGVAVWLDASFSTIRERVRPDGTRPLLADMEHAKRLYAERLPAYKLARVHVLTDNRLPDAIAQEILERVNTL
ncbi:MAG TPA: shikimate kinase [Terriglobia bacterium]|nr:shikimate kinase [Terriglobia bacterium]